MNDFVKRVRNSAVSAVVFSSTVIAVSWTYAAFTSWLSASDLTNTWATLSSASWNRLVNAVLELDGRTASVESFVGSAAQTSAVTAMTNSWVDVPWASLTFSLWSAKTLNLRAYGSVSPQGWSISSYTHCGFRFVIDGNPYGDATWWDQILGCNGASSSSPSWWWCPWNIERSQAVASGSHTVKVQAIWWGSWYPGCLSDVTAYSQARLFVRSR